MEATTYLNLHSSEGYILQAAAQIFAGHVAAGRVSAGNEAELVEKSIDTALRMAVRVDELVQTEDEVQ